MNELRDDLHVSNSAANQSAHRHYAIDITGKSRTYIANKLSNNLAKKFHIFLIATILSIILMFLSPLSYTAGILGSAGLIVFGIFANKYSAISLKRQIKWLEEADALYCVNEVLNGYITVDPATGFAFSDTFFYYQPKKIIIQYADVTSIYVHKLRINRNFVHTSTVQTLIIECRHRYKFDFFRKDLSPEEEKQNILFNPPEMLVASEIISRNPKVKLGYNGK